jgi:hypothetical protein
MVRSEEVEPAFLGLHLRDVDTGEARPVTDSTGVLSADRVALGLARCGLPPSASGKREVPWRWRQRCKARARQVWNGRLQGIKAVGPEQRPPFQGELPRHGRHIGNGELEVHAVTG